MTWESDPARGGEQRGDRSKFLWLGVAGVFAVMLAALVFSSFDEDDAYRSRVRVKHILLAFDPDDSADRLRALTKANELRERILAGESFRKFARDYSNDPASARRGGDLGWLMRDVLDAAIENYVWTAGLNELSDVISSSYGYHLVVVTDREISDAERYEQSLPQRIEEDEGNTEGGDGAASEE